MKTLDPGDGVLRPTAAAMLKRQPGLETSDDAWVRRQRAALIVIEAVTADAPHRELLPSLGSARDSIVVDDPVVLGRLSRSIADKLGLLFERALAATMATTTTLIEGRYDDAEASSQQAVKFGTEAGDPNTSAVHLTGAVMRGLDLGHAAAMVELMDAMRDELAAVPTFWGGFAMTAAEAGATDLAREVFATHAHAGFDQFSEPSLCAAS